jgi:HSP20 family protein
VLGEEVKKFMNKIVKFDPFRDIRRVMWSDFPFGEDWYEGDLESALTVDMYETENEVVLQTDLPGIKPEDVDIQVTSDNVTIQAERKEEIKNTNKDYVRRERRYGKYARTLNFPVQVVADKAEAKFDSGSLTLTIPKEKITQPKKVQVKVLNG